MNTAFERHEGHVPPSRLAAGIHVLFVLLAILVAPGPAFAHAVLVGTEPADGAVLAENPARFALTFSEPVSPLVLTLVRPDGSALALPSFRLAGRTVEIDNPRQLGQGTHALAWRVISADGHPVGGSILFSIGAPSAAPMVAEPIDRALGFAIWTGRVFLYFGLFLGVGGAFALAWLAEGGKDGERIVIAAILCGMIAAPISLGLQGLDALGAPLAHFAEAVIWRTALGTSFGWTVLIALMALGTGLLSLLVPRAWARPLAAAGLLAVGAALAASGHASAAEPRWLMRPLVFLHGAGIAFWTGALAPLGLAFARRTPEAPRFLARFSKTIPFVVAILAASGVGLAIVQVQTPSALAGTAYGRLLLVKLALLAPLFALAAVNRWKLTGSAQAGAGAEQRRLARSIGFETLIVALIFGVVAGWRFTPPPRALAIAAAEPASVHIHTLKAMADLSITPGHAGPVAARIVIMTGDFGPLDARQVTLTLSKPDSGIEPLKLPATKPGDGTWRIDKLVIPAAGRWMARLDIQLSDSDTVRIEGPVDIRP